MDLALKGELLQRPGIPEDPSKEAGLPMRSFLGAGVIALLAECMPVRIAGE